MLSKIPGYGLIVNIFATTTFRQSSITFAGTFLNGALGAVFYILAARFLGPASFGLMIVAITTLTLVSDIADFGTDTGLVNFVSRYLKTDETKANKFLKLGLKVKLLIGILVVAIGLVFTNTISEDIFNKPDLAGPLSIAFIGVLAVLLFSFALHYLQILQRFWSWSLIQVGTNLFRLLIIIILLYLGKLTLNSTLITYISIPLIGFCIALLILPRKFLFVKKETGVIKEFFKYNKWVTVFILVSSFSSRLDTFISARLLSTTDVGLYSAANQLVKIVPQIVTALGTVIAPKMAKTGTIKELIGYLKKTQILVLGLAFLGILSIPIVSTIIPIIYGNEYLSSIPLFIILLCAMLTFLISVPIHNAVFYYFSYPKLFVYLSIIHFGIILGLGWYLISIYGAVGAAVSVLVGAIVNLIIPLIWVYKKIIK